MATRTLHCDICAEVRTFEQPPCVDRHGPVCPEWACTGCATAILVAPVLLIDRRSPVVLRRPATRARARHAA